jgi:orotidine-5'-phosphate decarboxylase
MRNFADRLLDKLDEVQNPSCIGLDPRIADIPNFIKEEMLDKHGKSFKAVGYAIFEFNKRIIDATRDIVGVYKPQMAFYEQYGPWGVYAFQETAQYIKSRNRIVIGDAKRNDIRDTAQAYSDGHLGTVELIDGSHTSGFDVDAITVNAYLGSDCIKPFVDNCKKFGKGIFVLVRTSNPSSGEFQDRRFDEQYGGRRLYEEMALYVNQWGQEVVGDRGYSSVGAVVGATYPEQAKRAREIMERSIILVPGYGFQGGMGRDTIPNFNRDGYGAIVNSARGIIFAYQKELYRAQFREEDFDKAAREAALDMRKDLLSALKEAGISRW